MKYTEWWVPPCDGAPGYGEVVVCTRKAVRQWVCIPCKATQVMSVWVYRAGLRYERYIVLKPTPHRVKRAVQWLTAYMNQMDREDQ